MLSVTGGVAGDYSFSGGFQWLLFLRRSAVKKWIVSFVLLAIVVMSTEANARRWFRRSSNNNCSNGNCTTSSTQLTGSDQQKCQQKAQIMASRRTMSHRVAPLIGNYEGIGMGTSRYCGTCTPRGMSLSGDGAAQASNGMWYRCRSWR